MVTKYKYNSKLNLVIFWFFKHTIMKPSRLMLNNVYSSHLNLNAISNSKILLPLVRNSKLYKNKKDLKVANKRKE